MCGIYVINHHINIDKMNRIELISQINPIWAVTISTFVEAYPEFKPYIYLAPINPIEPIPYTNVNTLFEAIMHYICAVGVRYTYAVNQWTLIYPLICGDKWETILENSVLLKNHPNIQPKKREIYYNLCKFMHENNLTHKNLSISHLTNMQKNISGIGIGCVAWCKKYFTADDDCIEYTDIKFKQGFEKIYHTDSLTIRKNKAKEWKDSNFGRISNLMVLQIGGYT
jgi:hypothetical protein